MSVYTAVSKADLEAFLTRYDLGPSGEHSGISAGITNTNYLLDTAKGKFVLTLYEHQKSTELDYTLGLQHHLASKGVACAAPMIDRNGNFFSTLNDRPAAIIQRLAGDIYPFPGELQCAQIGAELARFHCSSVDYSGHRINPRGVDWWISMSTSLKTYLQPQERELIEAEIATYQQLELSSLPLGSVHADLFHDNALFVGPHLSGIIDFDYACVDYFVYDLAVTINDWCIQTEWTLDELLMNVLLDGYQSVRPLLRQERTALPTMLRAAALRFWLSRLYDKTYPMDGDLTFIKDPGTCKQILLNHRTRFLAKLKTQAATDS